MDRKTLEYMKNRVDEANKIVKKITHLKNANKDGESEFNRLEIYGPNGIMSVRNASVVKEVTVAAKEIIRREIELLEEELAKL